MAPLSLDIVLILNSTSSNLTSLIAVLNISPNWSHISWALRDQVKFSHYKETVSFTSFCFHLIVVYIFILAFRV